MKTLAVLAILTLAILLIGSAGTVHASQPTEPGLNTVALAPLHASRQLDPRRIQLSPELLFSGTVQRDGYAHAKAKPTQRADSTSCVMDCIVGCLGITPCVSACVFYQCIYNFQM